MQEDPEKALEDARKIVKEQGFFMKKEIEKRNMKDALRFSSNMLNELSTSSLSPKDYYILFMEVFDELKVLENHFMEEYKSGRKMDRVYESVQLATNIIPRLYLLITVGSVYIKTKEAPAKTILSDLLEMSKGIQHPLRGLFLRYYFLKMCKDKLPDKGNEFEVEGGDIDDSIEFIIKNLTEMNKLWIRMQGSKENKAKREKERIDIKVIVGENLHRLSSLEGVNLEKYKEKVLPGLLDLIIASKDQISQQYLIDCIIQTFPDEFHLHTLSNLLQACTTGLLTTVDIKTIFIRLMERLAEYALSSESTIENVKSSIDIFGLFKQNIDKIIEGYSKEQELKKFLDLEVAFLKFSLRCYPKNTNNLSEILKSCTILCNKNDESAMDDECQKCLATFLILPLEKMALPLLDISKSMKEFSILMKYLNYLLRRQVAMKICSGLISQKNNLEDHEIVEQLIQFINSLLKNEKDMVEVQPYEFDEEQELVAKIVHLITPKDHGKTIKILNMFKDQFLQGEMKRMKFTIPALTNKWMNTLKIAHFEKCELNFADNFKEIKELIDKINNSYPELALRLYLNLLLVINWIDPEKKLDEFSYTVAQQALLIYEDELSTAESKQRALIIIVGTLEQISCLGEENFDTLITNATQFSAKLLKKHEQCLAVLQCTHLFFNKHLKNEDRLLECMKKCIKTAEICYTSNKTYISLFISILNKFLYFFCQNVEKIQIKEIQDCINNIKKKFADFPQDTENFAQIKTYWKNTIDFISSKMKEIKRLEGLDL